MIVVKVLLQVCTLLLSFQRFHARQYAHKAVIHHVVAVLDVLAFKIFNIGIAGLFLKASRTEISFDKAG